MDDRLGLPVVLHLLSAESGLVCGGLGRVTKILPARRSAQLELPATRLRRDGEESPLFFNVHPIKAFHSELT